MNRADFGRVIAEFWADGPDSENPPGHWNVLANYVSNQTTTVKCIGGTGPIVNDLEWDVKMYFGLNASVHDAAVAAWNHKGIYDSARPISLIRYMGIPLVRHFECRLFRGLRQNALACSAGCAKTEMRLLK